MIKDQLVKIHEQLNGCNKKSVANIGDEFNISTDSVRRRLKKLQSMRQDAEEPGVGA